MNAAPLKEAVRMGRKLIKYLNLFARGLEIVISVIVLFAVIIQIFSLRNLLYVFVLNTDSMRSFHTFLDNVLILVIGLEFFRMLCFTNADTVLEVVLFVLARHMIVTEASAMENLLTVIGIAIVVLLNLALKYYKTKTKERKHDGEFHMLE